jgi:methylmalonyl-CoA epimerase
LAHFLTVATNQEINLMNVERIIEVGVAVKDLDMATKVYSDILGAKVGVTMNVDMYKMRFRYCRLGNVDFELMEPTAEKGVIADFIKRRGEGLHHIALKVTNLKESLSFMKQKGVSLIDEVPRHLSGDDNNGSFAFIHPSSFHGVLFELIEH